MLALAVVDTTPVVYRVLRLLSVVCCGLLVISFVMFADRQLSSASHHQVTEITTGIGAPQAPAPPVRQRGQPGRFIDGAASELTGPFKMIVSSSNQLVQRGLATVLALGVYGLGLGFLARYLRV